MRICPSCGQFNDDPAVFCSNCGYAFPQRAPSEQQTPVPPPPSEQVPAYIPQPPYPQTGYYAPPLCSPLTDGLRSLAGSTSLLVLAILFTVSPALQLIRGLFGGKFTLPIDILVCIGLWLLYSAAKSKPSPLPTTGITLIRIVQIISLVLACIVFGIIAVTAIALLAGYSMFGNALSHFNWNGLDIPNLAGTGLGILLFVVAVTGALFIIYEVIIIKFIGSIYQTVKTGYPSSRFAPAVRVFCYINAGFAIFQLLSSVPALVTSGPIAPYELLAVLTQIINVAIFFISGQLIGRYRRIVSGAAVYPC